jgi:hypothetical protein
MIIHPPITDLKYKDNFLENDLINHLEYSFLRIPHYYGHSSKADGTGVCFYNHEFNLSDPLIQYLCVKVQKEFEQKLGFLRVYVNVQHNNMDGDFHEDDGNMTILLMVSKTLKKGSGQFEIKKDKKIARVDFVQNRLIFFDARLKHRGTAPKEKNEVRITLAFKTNLL